MGASEPWEVILAVYGAGGPRVYYWGSQRPDEALTPRRVFIGLGAEEMAPLIDDSLNRSTRTVPEERLVELLAGINTIAAWSPWMLTRGMGGAFYGLTLSQAGFKWQPDIGYLLLTGCPVRVVGHGVVEPNHDAIERLVTVGVREGHLFVNVARQGDAPPQMRIIRNSTSRPPDNMFPEWWERWEQEIVGSFKHPGWLVSIRPSRSKVAIMRSWALANISSPEDRTHMEIRAMLHLDTELKDYVDMIWVQ